jgi:uncharacterized protein (UPF0332 family)
VDGSVTDLSKYRLETAKDDLATAKSNFEDARYRASVNRSYYSIFHALRALTALDQFDSGKHSGIIAYVNQHYVKEGIFDKSFSKLIDSAYRLREKADYEDFYIVAIEDARKQIEKAETVIMVIEKYVKARWDD